MPTIKCPDCGRDVSTRITACPHCGSPLNLSSGQQPARPAPAPEQMILVAKPAFLIGSPERAVAVLLSAAMAVFMIGGGLPFLACVGGFWLFLGIPAICLQHLIECLAQRLEVTTVKSVLHQGILSRKRLEIRHCDVRLVAVQQGILQRIFDTGNIAIGSAATAGLEIGIRGVRHPESVAEEIRKRQETPTR